MAKFHAVRNFVFVQFLICFCLQAYSSSASSLREWPDVQYLTQSSMFRLDASLLAAADSNVSFQWLLIERPEGSSASISGSGTGVIAEVLADMPGEYAVELVLTVDGAAGRSLQVQMSTDNNRPVAEIVSVGGVSPVTSGQTVRLSGAASIDPDGDALTYSWSLVEKPVSSVAAFQPDALFGEFTPDVAGDYKIQLTVTDPSGLTAVDTLMLTTGSGAIFARSGADAVSGVGQPVFVDAFASTQTAGAALSGGWHIVSAPHGSTAFLETGDGLSPPQPGRQRLTPDTAGYYVLGTKVAGGGALASDATIIAAGPNINVAPNADAGRDQAAQVGATVEIDATASSDANGDLLTYRWSVLSKPAGSAAVIVDPSGVRAELAIDVAGDYVFQLTVSDGKSLSFDTVVASTGAVAPVASAGADAVLNSAATAQVDGSASHVSGGSLSQILWSIVELASPGAKVAGDLSHSGSAVTNVHFGTRYLNEGPAAAIGNNSLIVFENANLASQVFGRTLVGGNLQAATSAYGVGLAAQPSPNIVLTVGGNANGQTINLLNAGGMTAGGSINAAVNHSGASVSQHVAFDIGPARAALEGFSDRLAAMPATSEVEIPTRGHASVLLNAIPGADGIAVFHIDGPSLLDNRSISQIDLQLNGADAIVINVSGNNVKFRRGDLAGNFNNPAVSAKVIWNFYLAKNVQIDHPMQGAILAPSAHVQIDAEVHGAVAARLVQQDAPISGLGFGAYLAFAQVAPPIDAAVLQIKASAGSSDSFDTALVTNANIAPVGKLQVGSTQVTPGSSVSISAASSVDANGDAIAYKWALIHRPDGTATALSATGGSATFVPDRRGYYVVQMTPADDALLGAPVTLAVYAVNRAPVIVSTAPESATVGETLSYAAVAEDADGDQLNWTLASGPAGMSVDAASGAITWTPVEAGTFEATIRVADGFGGADTQALSIVVEQTGNIHAPVIQPVADVSLRLGEQTTFTVNSSDQDGDAVTIWAAGLPAGATLDSATGLFTFTAGDQVGQFAITFTASDGIHTASTTFNLTVTSWPEADPTRLSGVVLDAADYANGLTTPVIGATVVVQGQTLTSGNNGEFSFGALAPGSVALQVDGRSASQAPDGKTYGSSYQGLTLYAHAPNVLPAPILLQRLGDGETQLTKVDDTLPRELRSCRIQRADSGSGGNIQLSALGLTASDDLVPGTQAVVWASAQTGQYAKIALGTVGADGRIIEGLTGSVPSGANLLVTPLPVAGQQSPLQPTDRYAPSLIADGNLQTGFALPGYSSLGVTRAPSFIYNSSMASVRPTILADITIPAETTLTGRMEAELYVAGQKVPGVTVTRLDSSERPDSALPVQGATSTASVSVTFDGGALATGVYPYTLYVFAGLECSAAAAQVDGKVFVNNLSESPYGAGWKPTEVQRLVTQEDGSVFIEEANGGLSLFSAARPEFDPATAEPGLSMTLHDFIGANIDLFNHFEGLPAAPFTYVTKGASATASSYVLPTINFPDNSRDTSSFYYIGPDSIEQNASNAASDDVSFQPPGGNDTFGASFKGYLYVPDGGNIQFRVGIDDQFVLYLDGVQLQARRQDTDFRYDIVDVANVPAGLLAIELNYAENTGEANIILEGHGGGLPNGILGPANLFWSIPDGAYAGLNPPAGDFSKLVRNQDGTFSRTYPNGAVILFNSAGRQVAAVDANGNRTSYEYDNLGRIIAVVDPVGLRTAYNYAGDFLQTVIDPDGRITTYNYSNGVLSGIQYPDGSTVGYGYDAQGVMISETDQRGDTTTYAYNANGSLSGASLPDGSSVKLDAARSLGLQTFGVDLGAPSETKFVAPEDRVSQMTDAKGNIAYQEVNEFGAVISTIDPLERLTRYERDENNRVTRISQPNSVTGDGTVVTDLAWDDKGNLTQKKEAVGTPLERTVSYEYNHPLNKVTRSVDPAGKATTYSYNAAGNLLSQVNPDGSSVTRTYTSRGLLATSTDERGKITAYAYDQYGRLTSSTDPGGIVTSLTLDGRGNPLAVTDALGRPEQRRISRAFDAMNRVTGIVDGENNYSSFTYDAAGSLLTTADPTGISSGRVYDSKGRLSSATDASAGTTAAAYDANDNLTRVTDSSGAATNLGYDVVNRVTDMTDALGNTSQVAYDRADNMIAVTDGRGNTTTFAYDALDRLISRTNPAGNIWSFEYDSRDRRTATIKPDGSRVEFVYDDLNRLLSAGVAGDAASLRSYTYDAGGNLLSAVAGDGASASLGASYTYNDRSEVLSATLDGAVFPSWSYSYDYDAIGRRIALRDSGGAVTTYLYDDADRLTGMTLPSGKALTMNYDGAGRRTAMRFPNGLSTLASFDTVQTADATGRLTSIAHGLDSAGAGGSPLNQRLGTASYSYDNRGDITGIAESATPPRTRNATLDALSRLTQVVDAAGQTVEAYTLDEEGNRVTSHLSSVHVTDPANRLIEDEQHQFEYDVNGNLVRKTVKASGLTWRYGYSAWDELVTVTRHASAGDSADLTVTWRYDALGRRVGEERRDASGVVTASKGFLHDGAEVAAEADLDALGAAIAPRRYTRTDGIDDLAALTLAAGSGAVSPTAASTGPDAPSAASYYYSTDHQGSVRAITDDAGTLVADYSYDSYGNPETAVASLDQPYRYTGREFDATLGLYHYRARAYDPAIGRFLQEDPLHFQARDLNIYRYTRNNPGNWTDPTGESVSPMYSRMAAWGAKQSARSALRTNSSFGCAFSLIEAALTIGAGEIISGVEQGAEGCFLKTKARVPGAPAGHGNSVMTPGKDNHVYIIMDAVSLEIRKIGISKTPLVRRDTGSTRADSQLKPGEISVVIGYRLTRAQALAVECAMVLAHKLALGYAPRGQQDRCAKL
jgi:RHS repeat-associated protein